MNLHIRVEGTAAEISQVLRVLPGAATVDTAAVELADEVVLPTTDSETSTAELRFVTTRFARRALTRLKLSKPMRNLLRALCEAHPNWLSQAEMCDASGYHGSQYSGLMGAFGRRLANTDGYDSEAHFFEYQWDEDNEAWVYRLPDSVREVLATEKVI